ncbi:MAG: carbonate dehydratase [Alphaproteobacteria bacterium 64-6]|nr:MAG: carbonate dehydratase [Alphaproteobacteria bacterium 64-6]
MPDRDDSALSDKPWHALPAETAITDLASAREGLGNTEAAARLQRHGPNALPVGARKSLLTRFLLQFHNVLIYVMIVGATITVALGHYVDTAVILAVIIINAIIGVIQENKAEAALDAIRDMISPRASVLREGHRVSINAADLVPGDVLLLEAGDRVTADIRLIKARNLRIDEAILTGESVAADKSTEPAAEAAALGDRRSMAYSGTLVTAGQGTGVVVATGTHSEIGRISALLSRVEQLETPLIRQMDQFARQLTIAILALCALTFLFAVFVRDYPTDLAFLAVVSMAVGAVPEGLPAVMTITLAIGVQRMAARNAIIRHLPAVETLGSVSTICSDKTGTLTRNEMTVTRVVVADSTYDVGGVGYAPKGGFSLGGSEADPTANRALMSAARAAILCNDAALQERHGQWSVDGDPMEGALMAFGLKAGYEREQLTKSLPRLDEIPFDAAHRYMATLHHSHDGAVFACIKGAPEQVLDMCRTQTADGGESPLDKAYWLKAIDELARNGQRVLALASLDMPHDRRTLDFSDVNEGLRLDALVGLIDPPRPEAIAAVAECRSAGISVKMITGDHAATAGAIAGELGLATSAKVVTGHDLDTVDDMTLRTLAAETSVFARTSPEHKLRLVEALQADGDVIAMTGDGVNDAPALKRADVGVAMGRSGTEAAKEASDMVLADDNFASIVAAVREGRTVYDNLTKVIGWTLPTNGGEFLIVVIAILFGITLPLTPVQILWINMVTTVGLGLVLAFEPAEPDIMQRPPRAADSPILSPFLLWRVVFVSCLFAIGALGIFAWALNRGLGIETARTMVVNTVVVLELFYLFSVRYLYGASLTWRGIVGTPAVLIGIAIIVSLQMAFTYLPSMQYLFQTTSIGFVESAAIIATGVALFGILEIEKRIGRALFPALQPRAAKLELRTT